MAYGVLLTAISNTRRGSGEAREEESTAIQWTLWGKQAESLTEYLVKGKQVYVEGSLQTDEYVDKEGVKKKSTKVKAQRIVLLNSSGGGARGGARTGGTTDDGQGAGDEPITDDDIPFNWLMPFIGAILTAHAAQTLLPLWS